MSGIISSMTYMNVRHQLPTIGIRQQQSRINKSAVQPAELHTDCKAPSNHQSVTQAKVEINQYPCRKAVGGFLNHEDFARYYGQKGFQDIAASTSKHSSEAWDAAKNAAKKGRNPAVEQARSKLFSDLVKWPQWGIVVMPSPEFTVTPSEIKGDIDPGYCKTTVDSTNKPNFDYTPGSAETYMKDKGFIRMWATQGYIDVEA